MFLTPYWRPTVQNACLEPLWVWNRFEVFFFPFQNICAVEKAGRVETSVRRVSSNPAALAGNWLERET